MELDIKREKFSEENFKVKDYLNYLLSNTKEVESSSDILAFKLKIIQREFSNEIDLNSNNVLKSNKTIQNDLKIVHQLNSNILEKVDSIVKENKTFFDSNVPTKMMESNEKINEAIELMSKK